MKKILFVSIAMFLLVINSFAQPVKETYLFAVKGTDSLYLDRMYDPSKMAEGDTPLMIHMFGGGMYGASAICDPLQEMGVPYWLYSESGGDHVLSYKAYFGYNTAEIQTFVKKWVIQGLPLQMTTMELNLVEPSHLPGANQQRPAAQNK